jgi:hypothetical protein
LPIHEGLVIPHPQVAVLPTERSWHSDEAGRADARRAARRARGEGHYGFYMIGQSNMDADKDRNLQLQIPIFECHE